MKCISGTNAPPFINKESVSYKEHKTYVDSQGKKNTDLNIFWNLRFRPFPTDLGLGERETRTQILTSGPSLTHSFSILFVSMSISFLGFFPIQMAPCNSRIIGSLHSCSSGWNFLIQELNFTGLALTREMGNSGQLSLALSHTLSGSRSTLSNPRSLGVSKGLFFKRSLGGYYQKKEDCSESLFMKPILQGRYPSSPSVDR